MFETHFGLTGRPFQLTPDPGFWFETATHRKAMAYLGYGLAQGEGFVVITGEIGAGKTTLVGHLMERIDPARLKPIQIVSTAIEADDLLRVVASGLGVDPAGKTKAELLLLIEGALQATARTGRRTLLVVDEAQALPVSSLEELRMLSNFQAGGHALLQIFLLGQPEFRDRLHGADALEQLRQRVIATHHLDPMAAEEVEAYLAHRLSVVGWAGRPDFADDAFPALHRLSSGVPRRLNLLASRVLLHCAVEEIELIDAAVIDQVADDRAAEPHPQAVVPSVAEPEAANERPAPRKGPRPYLASPAEPHPELDPEPVVLPPVTTEPPVISPEAPRPMTPTPAAEPPRPIRLAAVEPAPLAVPDTGPGDGEPDRDGDRLAALEARIEAQDAALRRVLTLLVEWVEGEDQQAATLRDVA